MRSRARSTSAGKQIVLPDGEWVVAGHGYDQVAGLEDVPYGAIENVVLFRLDGSRVTAFVIAQRNVIAIENGWGLAPECVRSDLLGLVVYDAAEGHSFCGFVDHVATAVDSTSASAWQAAMAYAGNRALVLPPGWLMAGFRRNDLTDMLDVRYHFDPALAGYPAAPGPNAVSVDWSRERIYGRATSGAWGVIGGVANHLAFWRTPPAREPAASPTMEARAAVVNDLRDWLARMRYAIQLGFENRATELASVPMPWDPAEQLFQPELAVRLAALGRTRRIQGAVVRGICPAACDRRGAERAGSRLSLDCRGADRGQAGHGSDQRSGVLFRGRSALHGHRADGEPDLGASTRSSTPRATPRWSMAGSASARAGSRPMGRWPCAAQASAASGRRERT